jgi:hypothetical protein
MFSTSSRARNVSCLPFRAVPNPPPQSPQVKDLMLTPIANEITEREPDNGYLIFLTAAAK